MKSEIKLQSKCYIDFHNSLPEYRGLLFAVNNNSQNAIKGSFNRAVGVVPGVSDMCLICPGGKVIWMEFKTATGIQSEKQKKWQTKVETQGHTYVIVRSENEFWEVINSIFPPEFPPKDSIFLT